MCSDCEVYGSKITDYRGLAVYMYMLHKSVNGLVFSGIVPSIRTRWSMDLGWHPIP